MNKIIFAFFISILFCFYGLMMVSATDGDIIIQSQGTNSQGVYTEYAPAGVVWNDSTSGSANDNGGSRYPSGTNTGRGSYANWKPTLPGVGKYKVLFYNISRASGDSKASIEVFHNGITENTEVNQNLPTGSSITGSWIVLGTFDFKADGNEYVKLMRTASSTHTYTTANAVKFEKIIDEQIQADATLSDISIIGYSLTPLFTSDVYTYNLTTTNSILSLNTRTTQSGADISIKGDTAKGELDVALQLEMGLNVINIDVVSQNGLVNLQYVLNITLTDETFPNPVINIGGNDYKSSGVWSASSIKGAYLSSVYSYTKDNWITWKPTLLDGRYKVSVYKLASADADNAANYDIVYGSNTNTVIVDQSILPSGWVDLGTYLFVGNMNEYVKLTRKTSTSVAAPYIYTRSEAVKFEKRIINETISSKISIPGNNGEIFNYNLSAIIKNQANEIMLGEGVTWGLSQEYEGITLSSNGLLTVGNTANPQEIVVTVKAANDEQVFKNISIQVETLPDVAPQAKNVIIQGKADISEVLVGTYTYYDPNGKNESISEYMWYISDTEFGTYAPMVGENKTTYQPKISNVGKFVKFEVIPKKEGVYVWNKYESSPVKIVNIPTAPVARNIRIDGQNAVGHTLIGNYDFFDLNGDLEAGTSYAWYSNGGLVGTQISYKVTNSDVGKTIEFKVIPRTLQEPMIGEETTATVNIPQVQSISSGGGSGGGTRPIVATTNIIPIIKEELKVVFPDIENHWAKTDIEYLFDKKIVTGENGLFNPDNTITRAEFIALLVRSAELQTKKYENIFDDVKQDDWYSNIFQIAAEKGLLVGNDGKARPNDNISRQEMAKLSVELLRIVKEINIKQERNEFGDVDANSWATKYIAQASSLGLVKGIKENIFAPLEYVTRAQAITVTRRIIDFK